MFGFAKLFTVGALAISASAAPLINADAAADVNVLGLAKVDAGAIVNVRDIADVEAGAKADVLGLVNLGLGLDAEVGRRDDATKTLQSVIADLTSQLTPVVSQISTFGSVMMLPNRN